MLNFSHRSLSRDLALTMEHVSGCCTCNTTLSPSCWKCWIPLPLLKYHIRWEVLLALFAISTFKLKLPFGRETKPLIELSKIQRFQTDVHHRLLSHTASLSRQPLRRASFHFLGQYYALQQGTPSAFQSNESLFLPA